MIEVAAAETGQLAAVLAGGLGPGDRVRIVAQDGTVAMVLAPGDLDSLESTQLLLAKNGALAAIAEGLADLAAGRSQDWLTLRTEFGRPGDEQAGLGASTALVSDRARWDLELLRSPIAELCFDQLDALISSPGGGLPIGLPMAAPFDELRISVTEDYRMVLRSAEHTSGSAEHTSGGAAHASGGVQIAHVDSVA